MILRKKHIPFYLFMVFAVACVTLPISQNEVHEIRLPEAPSEVIFPFGGVDDGQVEAVLQAMTLNEKIGQCLLWQPDWVDEKLAHRFVENHRIGGVLFRGMQVEAFAQLTDSLRQNSTLPLFIATDEQVALHGQFDELPAFPSPASIAAIDSTELMAELQKHYLDQCSALGINLSFQTSFSLFDLSEKNDLPSDLRELEELVNYRRLRRELTQLSNEKILTVTSGFDQLVWPSQDSTLVEALKKYHLHTRNGLPAMFFESSLLQNDSLRRMGDEPLWQYTHKVLNFNGLSFAEQKKDEPASELILLGIDQIITPDVVGTTHAYMELIQSGALTERSLDKRVRRILKAKAWMNGGRLPVEIGKTPLGRNVSFTSEVTSILQKNNEAQKSLTENKIEEIQTYFEHSAWSYFTKRLFEKSVILTNNHKQVLPFRNLLDRQFTLYEYDGKTFPKFEEKMSKYADFNLVRYPKLVFGGLQVAAVDSMEAQPVSIILLDGPRLHSVTDRPFIDGLIRLSKESEVVLVNYGYPENLSFFPPSITKFQIFERNVHTERYVAQALFGGVDVGGKLPLSVSQELPISCSENIHKMRLGFGIPEETGIAPERLVGINAIAETAIDNGVFPGCQVVVAKDGNVIFTRAFGQHEYGDSKTVRTNDMYDIASVTKVAATTLSLMKLAGQKSIDVNQKLSEYVGEAKGKTVGYLRLRNLLIHRSNLQAPMPISRYFNYRNVPRHGCNDIFCKDSTGQYEVQITPDLYFKKEHQDTIWQNVFDLKFLPRKKSYRYSDVNFFLLQKVVEERTKQKLDEYVQNHFYKPLGLRHLTYRPLEKVDVQRIVPTEKDMSWRRSLVHGYVHDPSAALMGGVGGNAGLFATAEDMAVLFQMMLDDGVYGGVQYLNPGTVKEFATAKYGNHRGLGFDMPTNRKVATYSPKAPKTTFGHNGFTGTCVWADPENDLVYVFLSNRVHPSSNNKKIFSENVRGRIHEVVYHAFDSFDSTLPELEQD